MERKFDFVINEFYHIYNRGVDKRDVFLNTSDYKRFFRMIYICNSDENVQYRLNSDLPLDKIKRGKPIVAIGAFCLMPNHFHLLITPLIENGITKFMLKIQTGYTMYFNKKNERTGSLFQGSYKAKHIDTDEYLKYIYAYIHLNPVKLIEPKWKQNSKKDLEKLSSFIKNYQYSSYQEYFLNDFKIIDPKPFPEYFESKKEFSDFIDFWLDFDDGLNVTEGNPR